MISRMSSGSSRADIAVEPTRSQNITVSCRRSAASVRRLTGQRGPSASAAVSVEPRLAIALRRRLRCPKDTPNFSRSPSVSSGRTSASMSFWRNRVSYWPRPRLRSQSPTSMIDPRSVVVDHDPSETPSPGDRFLKGSSRALVTVASSRSSRTARLRGFLPCAQHLGSVDENDRPSGGDAQATVILLASPPSACLRKSAPARPDTSGRRSSPSKQRGRGRWRRSLERETGLDRGTRLVDSTELREGGGQRKNMLADNFGWPRSPAETTRLLARNCRAGSSRSPR